MNDFFEEENPEKQETETLLPRQLPLLGGYSIIKTSCEGPNLMAFAKAIKSKPATDEELGFAIEDGETHWNFNEKAMGAPAFGIMTDANIDLVKRGFDERNASQFVKFEDISDKILNGEFPKDFINAVKAHDRLIFLRGTAGKKWQIGILLAVWLKQRLTVDFILDKISSKGVKSLLQYEQDVLDNNMTRFIPDVLEELGKAGINPKIYDKQHYENL